MSWVIFNISVVDPKAGWGKQLKPESVELSMDFSDEKNMKKPAPGGYGMYPFDVAIVFSSRWAQKEATGQPLTMGGCMDKVNESSKDGSAIAGS